jgi:hypothetical protein
MISAIKAIFEYSCIVPGCGNVHRDEFNTAVYAEVFKVAVPIGWRAQYGAVICPKHKKVTIKVDNDAEIEI